MLERIKEYSKWAFYVAILLTVAFIFRNSMLPPEESSAESETVGGIISEIIPPDTDLGSFILENLRKIAHFTEYGLLGIEIALYVCIYVEKKWIYALSSAAVPFAVGFFDETIQEFSGRGPAIADVWIDIGGFITFSCITYAAFFAVYMVVKLILSKRRSCKE